MAEGVESRKFERKPLLDVPLPMRRTTREVPNNHVDENDRDTQQPVKTNDTGMMKFDLLSKKGNRQQVCNFGLISLITVSALITNLDRLARLIFPQIRILPLPSSINSKPNVPSSSASRTWSLTTTSQMIRQTVILPIFILSNLLAIAVLSGSWEMARSTALP
jgi:regulator of nonsense transcripts 2